jgi:hypothetical protein
VFINLEVQRNYAFQEIANGKIGALLSLLVGKPFFSFFKTQSLSWT